MLIAVSCFMIQGGRDGFQWKCQINCPCVRFWKPYMTSVIDFESWITRAACAFIFTDGTRNNMVSDCFEASKNQEICVCCIRARLYRVQGAFWPTTSF